MFQTELNISNDIAKKGRVNYFTFADLSQKVIDKLVTSLLKDKYSMYITRHASDLNKIILVASKEC